MRLTIVNLRNLDLRDFIQSFLIPKIQEYFMSVVDCRRSQKIDDYIGTINLSLYNRKISMREVLVASIFNLVYTRYKDGKYVISIDPVKKLPNTKAKIIELAHMINYGTLSSPAYPIFDQVFNKFSTMLPDLYNEYIRGTR